ncbi:hypothetical protein C8R43DRAFT_1044418 [Mycena crocata]|nr:hypothetical protein C8R43DRAFT_1044418 [Mycena crocata]
MSGPRTPTRSMSEPLIEMHRCLTIPENLGMICSELGLGDLATMARTCSTFQRPALDIVWRSVELGNLLSCLPPDLWGVESAVKITARLLRPIRATDWSRVLFYSPRIKSLRSEFSGWVLTSVFPAIALSIPDQLFPNLQSLSWGFSKKNFHYVHLFLHPTLVKISLHLTCEGDLSLFSNLAVKCPRLKDISILRPTGMEYNSYRAAVSIFLTQIHGAEHISADSIDQTALAHISRLVTLRSLEVRGRLSTPSSKSTNDTQIFPRLNTLSMKHPHVKSVIHFLRFCSSSHVPLASFIVCFTDILTPAQASDIFNAVSAGISHLALTRLDVKCDFRTDTNHPTDHPIPGHSLQTLFCFGALTSVSIVAPFGFELDDTLVSALAQAWPRLETLKLGMHFINRVTPSPSPTLTSLRSFARYCPNLRDLLMTFDATVIPEPEANPVARTVQHRLRHLDVDLSAISTPISVARFISGSFSGLQIISTVRENPESDLKNLNEEQQDQSIEFHLRWKTVESFLPELLAIRVEERSWRNDDGNA